MSHGYKVRPMSIININKITQALREIAEDFINVNGRLDIVRLLDYLDKTDQLSCQIMDDNDWIKNGLNDIEAYVCHNTQCIYIKESVYISASDGNGRFRLTLAHELGHYILHLFQPIMARSKDSAIKSYEDSEWQANCFAGLVLAPTNEVAQIANAQEISETFGITPKAAEVRLNQSIKKSN